MKPTLFDYSNEPDLTSERLEGFETIVLSPRANETKAESCKLLREEGRLAFWVQPFISTWKNEIITNWEWDKSLADAVDDTHVLKDAAGNWLGISGHDINGVYVLDFRAGPVRWAFEAIIRNLDAPILFDYGTFDLSWEPNLSDVEPHVWPEWGRIWTRIKSEIIDDRGGWLQTQKTELPFAQAFEKINRLTTVQEVYWRTATDHRPIILWDTNQIPLQTISALAHILGAHLGVIHGVYAEDYPKTLDLGLRTSPNIVSDNHIILAQFEKGAVLLNVGQERANRLRIFLDPGEGLVSWK